MEKVQQVALQILYDLKNKTSKKKVNDCDSELQVDTAVLSNLKVNNRVCYSKTNILVFYH